MNSSEDRRLLSILVNSLILLLGAVLICLVLLLVMNHPEWMQKEEVKNGPSTEEKVDLAEISSEREIHEGIDVETGFIAAAGYQQVIAHCTRCHSSKLVLQNRATREGWTEMIRWMQETQKLWDLGEAEQPIVDYLAEHYGPLPDKGRRTALVVEEWYEIE